MIVQQFKEPFGLISFILDYNLQTLVVLDQSVDVTIMPGKSDLFMIDSREINSNSDSGKTKIVRGFRLKGMASEALRARFR